MVDGRRWIQCVNSFKLSLKQHEARLNPAAKSNSSLIDMIMSRKQLGSSVNFLADAYIVSDLSQG